VRFLTTPIPGVIRVLPDVHRDARGFFLETYHAPRYREGGIRETFVQDNHSRSTRDTLRGLHIQLPNAQGKLVRVIEGEIWDVAVDVRRGSPAYGKHFAARLTAEEFEQLYVPPGLAHGFLVLSEVAQVEYKCTQLYDPQAELSIAWNDPALAIPWPAQSPLLSERDRRAPRLHEVQARLIDYPA
jgi:dTDP-4-dehydrorhamnose 3,5-epimerase